MTELDKGIRDLVSYGIRSHLMPACERTYAANLLLDLFHEDRYEGMEEMAGEDRDLDSILSGLLTEAVKRGIIEDSVTSRDLFDTKLMNALCPRPGEVIRTFREKYEASPLAATSYFYSLSSASNYIRTGRVKKNLTWKKDTPYGTMDITINLSKPEKDPKAIAAALKNRGASYPRCQLCMENEGYAGRLDHPARENLRIIPLTLGGEAFGFQYSPYVYFNEHCIVLNQAHVPMKIDRAAFIKLLDFVGLFPHYFLGSNADLPIVGGSILTHEHFQGGHYRFAMEKAETAFSFKVKGFPDVDCGVVHWPLSVIRLDGEDKGKVIDLADHILKAWRSYTDEGAGILAFTDGQPHNTITPIARMRGGRYELDLALRNNRTTKNRPLGLFHPRPAYHHIKKENIGLIEVMGLAVLPARLKGEMEALKPYLLKGDLEGIRMDPAVSSHADWAEGFFPNYEEITEENIDRILRDEIGTVFCHVLEDAGVFPQTREGEEAFRRFLSIL